MSKSTKAMKNRRSIYALGENLPISKEEAAALVKEVVRESPAAFDSQTQRAALLFGDTHKKLWAMTEDALKPLALAEAFPNTQVRLQGSAAGTGTILFFEDTDIVKNLQDSFLLYADNFPVWSEQATGLIQANAWIALARESIGTNLQHYNLVVDETVVAEWPIPANWNLCAQMVIGSIEAPAGEREHMEDSARFEEFN